MLLLTALPSRVLAQEFLLRDPPADAHGPGTYLVPIGQGMEASVFDITEVRIVRQEEGFAITARFAKTIPLADVRLRRDGPPIKVFWPVVDIYFSGRGDGTHKVLLPGRRVLPRSQGWERAIVLSAVPQILKAHYTRSVPDLARDVCFPKVRLLGHTLEAFVDPSCIPSDFPSCGVLVLVTGLSLSAGLGSYASLDPSLPDAKDPFVREVLEEPGVCNVWEDGMGATPCAFGGCKPCGYHPFVLDAIVPEGETQEALLSNYSAKERRLAVLPFVNSLGQEASLPSPPPPPGPRYKAISILGRQLSIKKPKEGSYPLGTIGAIICNGTLPGGTAVVVGETEDFLVLKKVSEDSSVCEGAEVEF